MSNQSETVTQIQPAEVTRNPDGYWRHPDFPSFEDEGTHAEWVAFKSKFGLEEGWFILGIWDTEDGPTCCWARHKEQHHGE